MTDTPARTSEVEQSGERPMDSDPQFVELMRSLQNISPDPDQLARILAIRAGAIQFAVAIFEALPTPSRNRSLAITALEDATMRAVKAVLL